MNNATYRIMYEPEPGMYVAYCLEKKHKLFGLIPYWRYVSGSWHDTYEKTYTYYQKVKEFDSTPRIFYLE